MSGRPLLAAIAIGVIGTTLTVLFILTPDPRQPPARSTAVPTVLSSMAPGRAPLAPLDAPVVVVDGRFDGGADRTVNAPTRHKNQSKIFFAHGDWWGVLQEPISREARIHRLDWSTQRWHDTGVVVDERPYARADVLFADDVLYVASGGSSDSPVHAVRIVAFTIDPATMTWDPIPDLPVVVSSAGVESPLIDRTSSGVLWVSYIAAGRLLVVHSEDDIHRWTQPFVPNVARTKVETDQVGMTVVGDELLLLWSHQEDEAIYATSHRDGDSDDAWTEATTVVAGFMTADNHLNVRTLPDGRVFAVIKTSLDTVPASQPGWDQVLLLDRTDGRWSRHQVGQIRDGHTRPIVVLDTEHDEALVFATAPTRGGAILFKHSSFDDIRFPVGRGEVAIAADGLLEINDATSTKQPVDASTGLVVLASDNPTGRYVHLAASLGGPIPGRAIGPPPDGPEAAPTGPIDLVQETYASFPVGEPAQPLWATAPSRSNGTVSYVRREGQDVATRVRTDGTGELRPCRRFGATRSGSISIAADVRLDRQGTEDTTLLMARGDGAELGAIRVDNERRVRVSSGAGRETTGSRLRVGAFYRAELRLGIADQTIDVRLVDGDDRIVVERTGLPWRAPEVTRVDGLCVAAPAGAAGLGLTFDDVRVTRLP
jgi:hypothetical protein